MNPILSREISPSINGFNRLAMTFVVIFRITLQREIGLNLLGMSTPCSLGISVINVALKSLRIRPSSQILP